MAGTGRARGRRGVGRWIGAVAAGVVAFEGLDLLGSSPSLAAWMPWAASLPTVSPFLCGAAAAWAAGTHAAPALLAAAAAVWARIALDRSWGALQGVHLPPEYGLVLIFAFGLPWTVSALVGGAAAVLLRGALRRRGTTCGIRFLDKGKDVSQDPAPPTDEVPARTRSR